MDKENPSVPLPDLKILFNVITVYVIAQECDICFENCSCFVKLPCNHEFCENCMYTWFCLLKNTSCPSCRSCIVQQEQEEQEIVEIIGNSPITNPIRRYMVLMIPCFGVFLIIILASLPFK